jgi:hypothetical protein
MGTFAREDNGATTFFTGTKLRSNFFAGETEPIIFKPDAPCEMDRE